MFVQAGTILTLSFVDVDTRNQHSIAVPVSAIVTAFQRIDLTLFTISKLRACRPAPEEIIVHVDGNQTDCVKAIHDAAPEVRIIVSEQNVGPGGARNKLIAAAKHELVASFDDDSYPIDRDYFKRALVIFDKFHAASIVTGAVYHQGEEVAPDEEFAVWVSDFSGGACIYRRMEFLATGGYVPVPVAYGMEEVDLALRLHARGGRILRSPWLRVFHDTDLRHHADPEVTAASIANIALLTYLRYPLTLWIVGIGQFCKRVLWCLKVGRRQGIVAGLLMIPTHLWNNRRYRERVTFRSVRSYLALRRSPIPVVV